ncbi:MAG: hypothetical protein K8R69_03025 [Deltaproteobacteria bacterium]|nr:hypothetical protein [Deltaproteobacteria bacterium]
MKSFTLRNSGFRGLLFSLCLLALFSCGGGGAPPASIPAPVTQLMRISPPDQTGAVQITGQDGAALPNATVQARNVNQVGPFSWLKNLLLREARAQTFITETVANANGAFTLLIDGATGDQIDLIQELNGDVSDPVSLTVP